VLVTLGLAVFGILALCSGIILLVKAHEIAYPKRKLALEEYDKKMAAIEQYRMDVINTASDGEHLAIINRTLDELAGSYKPRRKSWEG